MQKRTLMGRNHRRYPTSSQSNMVALRNDLASSFSEILHFSHILLCFKLPKMTHFLEYLSKLAGMDAESREVIVERVLFLLNRS